MDYSSFAVSNLCIHLSVMLNTTLPHSHASQPPFYAKDFVCGISDLVNHENVGNTVFCSYLELILCVITLESSYSLSP